VKESAKAQVSADEEVQHFIGTKAPASPFRHDIRRGGDDGGFSGVFVETFLDHGTPMPLENESHRHEGACSSRMKMGN